MPTLALIRFCMQSQNNLELRSNIVFDLDGTLIDSAPSILQCLQTVVEKNGYLADVKFDSTLIGPPLRDTLKKLTKEQHQEKLDALVEDFKCEYDQGTCNLAKPYFGILTLLVDLKMASKNIYIVTNKRYHPTKQIISHLGWANLIDNIYTIDYPSKRFREKSQVIHQLLLDFSLKKEGTCYIGDRHEDWAAAATNGLSFIHVAWGYGPDDGVGLGLHSVKSPDQLRNLLIG